MKKTLTALFCLVSLLSFAQPTQLNLLKQAKIFGGTGKSILFTNGTAIDTLKSSLSNSYLKWDGSDFVFATVSGASIDTTTAITGLTTLYQNSLKQNLDADLTSIAGLSPTNDDIIQRKSGAWINRSLAQLKADMTYSLNDVTIAGNTSTAGITVSNGNVMLTTVSSKGAISLRQSSPGPFTLDLYPVELDDNYTLRFPATNDTLLGKNDIVKGLMPTEIGTAAQQLRVNSGATALEYFTPEVKSGWRRKYADQTMSTSFADVDDMNYAIAANDSVYFECILHVGTSANNGIRYTVTAPSGATLKAMVLGQTTTAIAAGASGNATQWITSSGSTSGTLNGLAQANQNAVITGWVVNSSTAGTVQIQVRSLDAGNTVTVYAGSMFTFHKY